jgi:hypothetical protein
VFLGEGGGSLLHQRRGLVHPDGLAFGVNGVLQRFTSALLGVPQSFGGLNDRVDDHDSPA